MDTDGFPLAAISEKSDIVNNSIPMEPKKQKARAPIRPADSDGGMENRNAYNSPATIDISQHSEKSIQPTTSDGDRTRKFNEYEVASLSDDHDDKVFSERPSQLQSEHDTTMVSSYATGAGENDVIEIHQFSTADIDAYLDIYFETLDNRLRRYIGQDEQLQEFRVATKKRISKKKIFQIN